jgi:hypothetical protein
MVLGTEFLIFLNNLNVISLRFPFSKLQYCRINPLHFSFISEDLVCVFIYRITYHQRAADSTGSIKAKFDKTLLIHG